MGNAQIVGGVSFHGGSVQAATVEDRTDRFIIRSIQENPSDILVGSWKNTLHLPEAADRTATALTKVFDPDGVPQALSVALPRTAAFLLSTPSDPSLQPQEVREHVEWELSNYYKGPAFQHIVSNFVRLKPLGQHPAESILIVALQRTILGTLQAACKSLRSKLQVLDIDHFCVESLLMTYYPNARTQHVLLIGNEEDRIQLSLLADSQLRQYRSQFGMDDRRKVEEVRMVIDRCRSAGIEVDALFLYGDLLNHSTLTALRSGVKVPVDYVDINGILSSGARECLPGRHSQSLHPSRFAPCIGAAIRKA